MTTTDERGSPALIECEAAARALYDYLDGRLPMATEASVYWHIETCRNCASHFAFARRVLDLVPSAVPLAGEAHALRARIVESLKVEGYAER
ncbi:MAG: zf-HC2 domain-containing protein [Gemmatimonadaceae bacterium]|nr:zf-HC2 domain-containing protein [Gemmatimonadaceae bacterium]